jgi:predicted type IV restriction endonuclease
MDLIDKLEEIASRVKKTKEQVSTEEATKNAFVMPFIAALGYDIFNPTEVIPEYTADIGTKKGEKVDYCINKDGQPIIIIECKHWKENLDNYFGQLHRYFHVTDSKFAILTNGIIFRFFTDLEKQNKMDDKPFLELNLLKINKNLILELKKFQKENFDLEEIISSASDLKYTKLIKGVLSTDLKEPSDKFVKYITDQVYSGRVTSKILTQFKDLVAISSKQVVNELINDRLQSAIKEEEEEKVKDELEEAQIEELEDDGIETTEEEWEAFRIIRAIARRKVSANRIAIRDTKSYCGILLDDNNRKPICRLHFNGPNKYIGTFGASKDETKHKIESIEEIYSHQDFILNAIENYDEEK